MKKNSTWIIPIILLLIIAVFFGVKSCGSDGEKAKLEAKNKELSAELLNQTDATNLYAAKLDTCEKGISKPLTVEERLADAEAKLAALRNQPAPATIVRYRMSKAPIKKNDVAETQFSPTSFVSLRSSSTSTPSVAAVTVTNVENNSSLSNTTYEGETTGDVGTTTNNSRNLIYFLKNVGLTGNVWYVNGDINKKMILDTQSNYYYYVDPRKLSDTEITSAVITWNIKGSDINWGGGTYQAWWPHESLKPLLNSVRGFEYGYITNDDLNQMSRKDSRVWSPTNPNGIYQPLQGISGKERTDTNFWHGWNFRTKISYKRTVAGISGQISFIRERRTNMHNA